MTLFYDRFTAHRAITMLVWKTNAAKIPHSRFSIENPAKVAKLLKLSDRI